MPIALATQNRVRIGSGAQLQFQNLVLSNTRYGAGINWDFFSYSPGGELQWGIWKMLLGPQFYILFDRAS